MLLAFIFFIFYFFGLMMLTHNLDMCFDQVGLGKKSIISNQSKNDILIDS